MILYHVPFPIEEKSLIKWGMSLNKGDFKKKNSNKLLKMQDTISHASKVMLKILQARLQQYVNRELPSWFEKRQRNQRSNCQHPLNHEKAREFQKNIYFCFIDCAKAFDCMDHNKLENSSRDGNTNHLTCLLRNLYAGQEATVRTGHGTAN